MYKMINWVNSNSVSFASSSLFGLWVYTSPNSRNQIKTANSRPQFLIQITIHHHGTHQSPDKQPPYPNSLQRNGITPQSIRSSRIGLSLSADLFSLFPCFLSGWFFQELTIFRLTIEKFVEGTWRRKEVQIIW